MDSIIRLISNLRGELQKLPQPAQKSTEQLERVQTAAERLSSSLLSTNPFELIIQGGQAVYKIGAQAEQAAISFHNLVGHQEQAAGILAELRDYANTSGYDHIGLITKAQNLIAAGMPADALPTALKKLGEIAMGDADKLRALSQALTHVMTQGRLSAESLEAFAAADFNPLIELSQMTGSSYAELSQMMMQGSVSAQNVLQAIAHATEQGGRYYGAIDSIAQSALGRLNIMMAQIQGQAIELFSALRPIFDLLLQIASAALPAVFSATLTLANVVATAVDLLRDFAPELSLMGSIIGILALKLSASTLILGAKTIALGIYSTAVTLAGGALYKLEAIMRLLNISMMANPIGAVIAALGILIAVVLYCWHRFAGFRAFLLTMWDTLKDFGSIIKDYITGRVTELLEGLGAVGRAVKALFSGEFDTAASAVSEALGKFAGRETSLQLIQSSRSILEEIPGRYETQLQREQEDDEQQTGATTNLISPTATNQYAPLSTQSVIFSAPEQMHLVDALPSSPIASTAAAGNANSISIGKLVETINIHMNDTADTAELEEMILRAINQALALANSSE